MNFILRSLFSPHQPHYSHHSICLTESTSRIVMYCLHLCILCPIPTFPYPSPFQCLFTCRTYCPLRQNLHIHSCPTTRSTFPSLSPLPPSFPSPSSPPLLSSPPSHYSTQDRINVDQSFFELVREVKKYQGASVNQPGANTGDDDRKTKKGGCVLL